MHRYNLSPKSLSLGFHMYYLGPVHLISGGNVTMAGTQRLASA